MVYRNVNRSKYTVFICEITKDKTPLKWRMVRAQQVKEFAGNLMTGV